MCSVQKDLFEVFQSLHCKISGILLLAKPSQQLLSMVVDALHAGKNATRYSPKGLLIVIAGKY